MRSTPGHSGTCGLDVNEGDAGEILEAKLGKLVEKNRRSLKHSIRPVSLQCRTAINTEQRVRHRQDQAGRITAPPQALPVTESVVLPPSEGSVMSALQSFT